MAQVFVFGQVGDDLELKTSQKGNVYVCFWLRERLAQGRYQQYQVWAWGEDAQHLERLCVKKGSIIWLAGSLQLVDCTVNHGQTKTKLLKVALTDWGFLPTHRSMPSSTHPAVSEPANNEQPPDFPGGILDGDRDTLP